MRWAKACMARMVHSHKERPLHVLEVACGRGEDADCWSLGSIEISYLVATDTADGNVKEASERFKQCLPSSCAVQVLQCDPREEGADSLSGRFDVVYVNPACLSNAFKDKHTLSAVCAFLSACVAPGGFLCGTCFNSSALWARAQKSDEPSPKIRAPGVSIAFPSRTFRSVGTHFRVRVGDALVADEHFLPSLQTLIRSVCRNNLRFDGALSMSEFAFEYGAHAQLQPLFTALLAPHTSATGRLSPETHDALALLTVFTFSKLSDQKSS